MSKERNKFGKLKLISEDSQLSMEDFLGFDSLCYHFLFRAFSNEC